MENNEYEALIKSGSAHSDAKEFDETITDYTKATGLEQNNPQAYKLRAYAYDEKKDYAGAIKAYEEAIRLVPDDPMLKVQLATMYGQRGAQYLENEDYWKAMDSFSQALDLDPNDSLGNNALLQKGLKFASMKTFSETMTSSGTYAADSSGKSVGRGCLGAFVGGVVGFILFGIILNMTAGTTDFGIHLIMLLVILAGPIAGGIIGSRM
jgi:tetratricopeptide (TPR) repeat protein